MKDSQNLYINTDALDKACKRADKSLKELKELRGDPPAKYAVEREFYKERGYYSYDYADSTWLTRNNDWSNDNRRPRNHITPENNIYLQ